MSIFRHCDRRFQLVNQRLPISKNMSIDSKGFRYSDTEIYSAINFYFWFAATVSSLSDVSSARLRLFRFIFPVFATWSLT